MNKGFFFFFLLLQLVLFGRSQPVQLEKRVYSEYDMCHRTKGQIVSSNPNWKVNCAAEIGNNFVMCTPTIHGGMTKQCISTRIVGTSRRVYVEYGEPGINVLMGVHRQYESALKFYRTYHGNGYQCRLLKSDQNGTVCNF